MSKFASVGLCATAIQYAILSALVEACSTPAALASTIGFALSSILNYLLNRKFTFQSDARHLVAAPKFLITALVGMTVNTGIIAWFEYHTGLHYLLSQSIATTIGLLWNFGVNAAWTFKHHQ